MDNQELFITYLTAKEDMTTEWFKNHQPQFIHKLKPVHKITVTDDVFGGELGTLFRIQIEYMYEQEEEESEINNLKNKQEYQEQQKYHQDEELEAPEQLIVKIPKVGQTTYLGKDAKLFHNEILAYKLICPQNSELFPKVYFSEIDLNLDNFIIVMEDLTLRKGKVDYQFGCNDVEASIAAVKNLAQFHGKYLHYWKNPTFDQTAQNDRYLANQGLGHLNTHFKLFYLGFTVLNPQLQKQISSPNFGKFNLENQGTIVKSILDNWPKFMNLASTMNFSETEFENLQIKDKAEKLSKLVNFAEVYENNIFSFLNHKIRSIIHNDFRFGNIQIDIETQKIKVFDWQLSGVGNPLWDLYYFLQNAFDGEEKKKHEIGMLKIYSQTLINEIKHTKEERLVKIITYENLLKQYKRCMWMGSAMSLSIYPLIIGHIKNVKEILNNNMQLVFIKSYVQQILDLYEYFFEIEQSDGQEQKLNNEK